MKQNLISIFMVQPSDEYKDPHNFMVMVIAHSVEWPLVLLVQMRIWHVPWCDIACQYFRDNQWVVEGGLTSGSGPKHTLKDLTFGLKISFSN